MSSTSVTSYDVMEWSVSPARWEKSMTTYDRKMALERAEALNKTGKKWVVWKRTERSEMIGKG